MVFTSSAFTVFSSINLSTWSLRFFSTKCQTIYNNSHNATNINVKMISHQNLPRSEEHTSELQSRQYLVCRLLLEKNKKHNHQHQPTPTQPVQPRAHTLYLVR